MEQKKVAKNEAKKIKEENKETKKTAKTNMKKTDEKAKNVTQKAKSKKANNKNKTNKKKKQSLNIKELNKKRKKKKRKKIKNLKDLKKAIKNEQPIKKIKQLWRKLRSKRNVIYFENMVEKWLEYKGKTIKESTYYNYVYKIEKYLNPIFNGKKINDFKNFNFEELINNLSEELSSKTIKDIVSILKAIIKYSEKEFKRKLNPEEAIVPKTNKREVAILSKKEKRKIERYCKESGTLRDIGILVCLYTGVRVGEICALKWKNIDLDKKMIYIEKTMQRIVKKGDKSKIIVDTPKSQNSIRAIPISNKLYQILKPLREQNDDESFFLTGEKERYIEPRNYQYMFKRILRILKIKKYKFHALRHTFASECIEVGMDVKALSEILGHASVDITLNIYVHSSYKQKRKYLEKL